MPTVSIITAVRNASHTIKDCLESINSHNYKHIEHIIVDGCSTDGTFDIIKEKQSRNTILVSEPDDGMYDALNKGISMATGEIVGILHSDDVYAVNSVIESVVKCFEDNGIESCYGDLVYVDRTNMQKMVRYWKAGRFEIEKFKMGWMPPHPTFFVRRSVYEKYGLFNLKMGSAADYELMLRFLVKHKITTAYIPEVLIKMRTGGISNSSLRNRIRANRMDRKAWEVNGLKPYPWTTWLKPLRKIGQYFV